MNRSIQFCYITLLYKTARLSSMYREGGGGVTECLNVMRWHYPGLPHNKIIFHYWCVGTTVVLGLVSRDFILLQQIKTENTIPVSGFRVLTKSRLSWTFSWNDNKIDRSLRKLIFIIEINTTYKSDLLEERDNYDHFPHHKGWPRKWKKINTQHT